MDHPFLSSSAAAALALALGACKPGASHAEPHPLAPSPVATVPSASLEPSARPPAAVSATPSASAQPSAGPLPAPAASDSAPVIDASPTSAGAPAPVYAELFKKGTTWKVTVSSKHAGDSVQQKNTNSLGKCSVADVTTRPWAVVSRIDCANVDTSSGEPALAGYWLATAAGLFHAHEEPVTPPVLDENLLVLQAKPAALSHERTLDVGGERFTIEAQAGGYCASHMSWSGDESWTKVCIVQGKGFVSGSWGWAGGSTHESEFVATKVP